MTDLVDRFEEFVRKKYYCQLHNAYEVQQEFNVELESIKAQLKQEHEIVKTISNYFKYIEIMESASQNEHFLHNHLRDLLESIRGKEK